jgi:hypothetical protein
MGRAHPKTLLQASEATVAAAMVSPEGRWLTCRSTETGRSEAYIAPFPKPGGKIQVSVTGGRSTSLALGWQRSDKRTLYVDVKEESDSLQAGVLHLNQECWELGR